MITRLWRGRTTVDNADAYEQFLLGELFPSIRKIPDLRGGHILRRLEHDEVAFITLTRFDSLAAIQAFAGDDYETPVLEPQALALLARYEWRALQFDMRAECPQGVPLPGSQCGAGNGRTIAWSHDDQFSSRDRSLTAKHTAEGRRARCRA
jgi:hypothetical protein